MDDAIASKGVIREEMKCRDKAEGTRVLEAAKEEATAPTSADDAVR